MAAFVWGEGGVPLTPEEAADRRKLARAMQMQGTDTSPVQSWTQGAARVAQAMLGAWDERSLAKEIAAARGEAPTADGLLGMGGAAPAAVVPAASAPAAGVSPVAAGAPSDREKQAFDYFVAQGHNPAAAAGIVGNLIQESRLNPAAVNPQDGADGSNSIGVAQWNGPRAIAFKQFAAANKADPNDFNTQLSFVQHELTGPEMRVGQALRNVNDPTAAAGIFAGYERPQGWKEGGDPSAIHGWQNRSGNAARIFAAYGGAVPPQGAPAPLAGPVQVASADPNFVPQNVTGVAPPAAVAPPVAPPAVVTAPPAGAGVDPGNPLPPVQRVAQAIAAAPAAPAATPAPGVQAVAQALSPQTQAAFKALDNPWSSEAAKAVARSIIAKSQADPNERVLTQLKIDQMRAEAADRPLASRKLLAETKKLEQGDPSEFTTIGRDAFGNPIMGFVDKRGNKVTPYTPPAPANPASPVMVTGLNGEQVPVPSGMDPATFRKTLSEAAAAKAAGPKGDDVAGLRKEVQNLPSYKNVAQAAPIYRSMLEAAGRDTKAADLNLVYGLGKIMDPGSVVREGEIVMANDTGGLQNKLNGFIAGIQGEGRLRPDVREALMQEAHGRMMSYKGMFDQDAQHYTGIATRNKMNVEDIIPNFGAFEPYVPKIIAKPKDDGPKSGGPDPAAIEAEMRRRGLVK